MSGRMVIQQFKGISVPADSSVDIWSILASATSLVRLHGFELYSNAIAAAMIDVDLHRISAVGSGGAASSTEELLDERFTAVTASLRTLDTTIGTLAGGLMGYQWEQLGPIGHIFTPEMRPLSKVSEGFALTLNTATAFIASGFVAWEETGA